ncbi:MAG TPA: hypothetical protein VIA29_09695 [Thermoanaerobaculia bacterium]
MSRPSLLAFVGNLLFVFYCTAVGVYLVLRPWHGGLGGAGLATSHFFRGFVSGLGLIHLIVGFADLRGLTRFLFGEETPPGGGA